LGGFGGSKSSIVRVGSGGMVGQSQSRLQGVNSFPMSTLTETEGVEEKEEEEQVTVVAAGNTMPKKGSAANPEVVTGDDPERLVLGLAVPVEL